ncbi:hypothetical protein [Streptomyces sp. NPDC052701]|uniref:hypothetical protein n=1 Tax=Streptomyces sp. NPDC052701 TaxID=3155533 RepID=UPI0034221EA1
MAPAAIRAARTAPVTARDEVPAATAPATTHTQDHHDQDTAAPHAAGHPGRHATLTPAQQAAAVHAHRQAAMPELLEGRTTDPATWMRAPGNLARLTASKREADARRRAVAGHRQPEQPAESVGPADQRQHPTPRTDPGRGAGRDR